MFIVHIYLNLYYLVATRQNYAPKLNKDECLLGGSRNLDRTGWILVMWNWSLLFLRVQPCAEPASRPQGKLATFVSNTFGVLQPRSWSLIKDLFWIVNKRWDLKTLWLSSIMSRLRINSWLTELLLVCWHQLSYYMHHSSFTWQMQSLYATALHRPLRKIWLIFLHLKLPVFS